MTILDTSIGYIIAFLIFLNPFALFLYLKPVKDELNKKDFFSVLFYASLISFIIYAFFVLTGTFIFESILNIDFESFRIFGGVVIFAISYLYIVTGRKAMIKVQENLGDLASEIALPFFVGAGTISLSVLMGKALKEPHISITALFVIMTLNYLIIATLFVFEDTLSSKFKIAFDKAMGILLRLMGLFMGAIGVNMIITGIKNLFF